jgi:hypothetical protein
MASLASASNAAFNSARVRFIFHLQTWGWAYYATFRPKIEAHPPGKPGLPVKP